MTTAFLIPPAADAELLCCRYLAGRVEVTGLLGDRIGTAKPRGEPLPQLAVTRIGGTRTARGWLDHPRLQLDVWGASKRQAHDALQVALAVLLELPWRPEGVQGGVVTAVDVVLGPTWQPDAAEDPPVPRYVADVALTVHPPT